MGILEFNEAFELGKGMAAKIKLPSMQAYAVVKVVDRTKPVRKVKLAILQKKVTPSDETYRDFLMKATDLADRANGKYAEFDKIVKEESLPVIPASRILEATRTIGVCQNARQVVQWAFDAKKNQVSDVITVDNKYHFVVAVTDVRKEGYAPIEEVSGDISSILTMEKKSKKVAEEMAAVVEGMDDLEKMAEALETTVSHQTAVSFGSNNMSLDPVLTGAVAGAQKGQIVGPIEGSIGAYIFKVVDTQTGNYYTSEDAVNASTQLQQYRAQMFTSIANEEAKVKDYRARFF
jgi:peptidyl-prolyl cis-trans isomerase D